MPFAGARGLSLITICETTVYEYGRTPDKLLKSNQRRHAREWLSAASPEMRQNRLEKGLAEAADLPPPHLTYEEYKVRQVQYKAGSSQGFQEVARRVLAEQAANLPKPPSSSLSPDRATRMLAIARAACSGMRFIQMCGPTTLCKSPKQLAIRNYATR